MRIDFGNFRASSFTCTGDRLRALAVRVRRCRGRPHVPAATPRPGHHGRLRPGFGIRPTAQRGDHRRGSAALGVPEPLLAKLTSSTGRARIRALGRRAGQPQRSSPVVGGAVRQPGRALHCPHSGALGGRSAADLGRGPRTCARRRDERARPRRDGTVLDVARSGAAGFTSATPMASPIQISAGMTPLFPLSSWTSAIFCSVTPQKPSAQRRRRVRQRSSSVTAPMARSDGSTRTLQHSPSSSHPGPPAVPTAGRG